MREEQEQKVVGRGSLLLPVPQHVPNQTCQILQHMRKDEVYRVAVNDPLIMQFAHKLTMKHYADRDRHEHIRCKIREVGRLMLHLRKDHGITSLADALDPTQFQKVVSCVRKVAGFNDETNTFAIPSFALKLGHALKKCAMSLISEALQTASKEKEEKANAFIRLCEIEWKSEVSAAALSTLYSKKLNRVTIIPLTEDIMALHNYLTQSCENAVGVLQAGTADTESWLRLAQVMLAQLILSNRRRVGEVSKMTPDDVMTWWESQNTYPNISKLARALLAIPATSVPSERIFSLAGLASSSSSSYPVLVFMVLRLSRTPG